MGVIGLGYVGLPTAVAFAQAGFPTVGIEIDAQRCASVGSGRSHVEDVPHDQVARLIGDGGLEVVGDLVMAGALDVVDICVPTPLDAVGDPDLSALVSAVEAIASGLRAGQLILLTSTTYPGTTVEIVRPALEASGLEVGRDVFLAFAPERIDPGNSVHTMRTTPRVVGGATPVCADLAREVLGAIADTVVVVSSPAAAEMTKLLENTFRSVNIALANEVAMICRRLGVDVWEVIEGASTKPYGFMPFQPGPGLGGHCIPVDPNYLSWRLRRANYTARFINLAADINGHMPPYVVARCGEILNDRCRSVRGSRIMLLGVAYKADVGDLRKSPALDIMVQLRQLGAEISYSDPHVPALTLDDGATLESASLTPERLAEVDLAVVTTAHRCFDWHLVHQHARLVLDTRGRGRSEGWSDWHSL